MSTKKRLLLSLIRYCIEYKIRIEVRTREDIIFGTLQELEPGLYKVQNGTKEVIFSLNDIKNFPAKTGTIELYEQKTTQEPNR